MSLAKAVLDVAAEMDEMAKDTTGCSHPLLLRSFARELRTAVKAAEPAGVPGGVILPSHSRPPMPQEGKGERMADCVGGSFSGDFAPVGDAPVGAFIPIGDAEVYQLREDGKLHFSAAQTQRYLQAKRGK